MNGITLGFSRPRKWKPFAWAIMKMYGIDYDHVYIKFWSDKFQRYIIYQASHTIVNFMSKQIFDDENIIIDEFDFAITDDNRMKMVQFAMDNAGKPYGIWNCVGLAIVRLYDLFGKKIKNPFSDDGKTYICCELGAYILAQYTDTKIPFDFNTINPKELREYLISLKDASNHG